MLGTFATTAILALASTSAAPPNHHRQAVNHRHGCQTRACDKRADAAFARHRARKLERELASGWAIPTYIVMCESRGQNLPPNSADASGYYQVLGADSPYGDTWRANGGGPPYEAYLHSKAEQDRVARHIWNAAGSSQWDCA